MPFTFKRLSIHDVILAQPKSFSDDRGFFLESFKESDFVSNGMLMRLAFATSVLVDPDILIIDEVLAVGDIRFQKKCAETILSFKKRGKAIIFVSHNMKAIQEHADRAMFLNNGKAEKIGSPADVIASYGDFCRARDKLDDSSNK